MQPSADPRASALLRPAGLAIALLASGPLADPAAADVTITQRVSQELAGSSLKFTQVVKIHGPSMRIDSDIDGARESWIYDLLAGSATHLDFTKREARIYDATLASAAVERTVPEAQLVAQLRPTGRSRVVLGVTCEEYAFDVRMSLQEEVVDVVDLSGRAWLTTHAAGLQDYLDFVQLAARRRLLFADRGAREQADTRVALALARGHSELHRRFAALAAMPCAVDLQYRREQGGVKALVDPRFRGRQQTKAVAVTTSPLPSETFVTPPDWPIMTTEATGPYRRVLDDPGQGPIHLFGRRFWLGLGAGASALSDPAARAAFGRGHVVPVVRLVSPLRSQGLRLSLAPALKLYGGGGLHAWIVAPTAGLSFNLASPRRDLVPYGAIRAGPYLVRVSGAGMHLQPGANLELGLSVKRRFVLSGGYELVGHRHIPDFSNWSLSVIVRAF